MENLPIIKRRCQIIGGLLAALGCGLLVSGYVMSNKNKDLLRMYGYSANHHTYTQQRFGSDSQRQRYDTDESQSKRITEWSRELVDAQQELRKSEAELATKSFPPFWVYGAFGFGGFSFLLGIVLQVVGWVMPANTPTKPLTSDDMIVYVISFISLSLFLIWILAGCP